MTFYIGKEPTIGNYAKMDSITAVNGQATYNLLRGGSAFAPQSANHVICSLNSIIQNPGSSFTISGSQIIFASNLQTGDSIDFILVLGDTLSIGVPSDDTIDSAKLKTNSVVEAKIQDDAVTRDKINAISTTSLPSFEAKGTSGQTDGYIQLNCEQNTHGIKLKSPPHSAGQSYTLTFPSTAPGTDKILQTNSSGVLSFIDTPSGNLVKLTSGSISSGTSALELEFFTSTYNFYQFHFENVVGSSGSVALRFRLRDSSGNKTGTNYKWSFAHPYRQSNNSGGINEHGQWGVDYISWGTNGIHTDAGQGANGVINFTNTHQSDKRPFFFGHKVSTEGGTQLDNHIGGGFYDETFTCVGFSMYFQGYTISSGNYALYGVKS